MILGISIASWLFPNPISAQVGGTFGCQQQIGTGACVVGGINNCSAGYRPDPSRCTGKTGTACNQTSENCVPNQVQQNPGQNICVQMPAGGCKQGSEVVCQIAGNTGLNYCCSSQQACQQFNSGNTAIFNSGSTQNNAQQPTQIKPQECQADSGVSNSIGIETALGCIPTDPASLIGWIFKWGLALGGGIAFIFMAMGAFYLITSKGNPEQIKAGQEFITSAVIGILFIVFAIYFMRLIGFQILQIPGFG